VWNANFNNRLVFNLNKVSVKSLVLQVCNTGMVLEDDIVGQVELDLPYCTKHQAVPVWTLLEPEGAIEYKAFVHPKMDVDSSIRRPRFPSFFVVEVHSATELADVLTLGTQVNTYVPALLYVSHVSFFSPSQDALCSSSVASKY
jgi:hypothetical protein